MKIAIVSFIALVGLALLVLGYTSVARFNQSERPYITTARETTRKFLDEERAKYPQAHEHDFYGEQLRPFDELADKADEQTARIVGTVQYCAGWILLGIAGATFALSASKK